MVTLPILLERCPSELTETPLVAEAGYENTGTLDVAFIVKIKEKGNFRHKSFTAMY